jgi:hypothetical protein
VALRVRQDIKDRRRVGGDHPLDLHTFARHHSILPPLKSYGGRRWSRPGRTPIGSQNAAGHDANYVNYTKDLFTSFAFSMAAYLAFVERQIRHSRAVSPALSSTE